MSFASIVRRKKSEKEPPRLMSLDVLRGVAILSVVVFHTYVVNLNPSQSWVMRFIGQGAEGVGLFFILSALTLGLSWDYRQTKDRHPRLAFWSRRVWRIAPLFYLVLLVTPLLTHGNPKFASPHMTTVFTWGSFLAHITFIFGWIPSYQNSWIGVGWSIGAEMSFYLLFPWLVERVLPRLTPEGLLAASLAMVWVWPYVMTHIPGVSWPGWAFAFLFWAFPSQFVWFAIGLWIWKRQAWKPRRWWWALLWAGLAIGVANQVWSPMNENVAWLLPNLFLVWISWHDLAAMRWLTHLRILEFIGKRSYSVYLIHWFVLKAFVLPWVPDANQGSILSFVVRTAAVLGISLGLAHLSYQYLEQPGIRLGKVWLHRRGWDAPDALAPGASEPRVVAERTMRQAYRS